MSWTETKITVANSKHFETLNGLWTGKREPFVEAGVIRNTNFTPSGVIDFSNVAYLQVEEKQLIKRRLEAGDIILERSGGGPKQPVGRVVFFERQDGDFSFSNFTSAIRVKDKTAFDPRFVFYGLMEIYQSGQTEDIQRRTTGIRNLDFTAYKDRARFPKIPLPEQKKIAHILSTAQQAIEAQERIIQTATELKKALMHKLFTEGLRNEPQKQTEIGPVPESWEVVELQNVCQMIVDCPHTTPKFLPEGVRVARNFNIRDGRFVSEPAFFTSEEQYQDRVRRSVPQAGDVLFSREAPVGEACVIPDGIRLSLGQRTMLIRTDQNRLIPDFLVYSFYNPVLSAYMKSIASGLTVAHLNVADVRRLLLPLPSLSVQNQIAKALLAIERKGEHHRTKVKSLQDLFNTLLHELMTAKTRVQELEITL